MQAPSPPTTTHHHLMREAGIVPVRLQEWPRIVNLLGAWPAIQGALHLHMVDGLNLDEAARRAGANADTVRGWLRATARQREPLRRIAIVGTSNARHVTPNDLRALSRAWPPTRHEGLVPSGHRHFSPCDQGALGRGVVARFVAGQQAWGRRHGRHRTRATRHPSVSVLQGRLTLDPQVTLGTPPWLWLSTGIREFDHAVEDICSIDAQPFSPGTALQAIRLLGKALPATHRDPLDLTSRVDGTMAMWLSSVKPQPGVNMGASPAIGHALGGTANVSHDYTSCIMMPHVMRINAPAGFDR